MYVYCYSFVTEHVLYQSNDPFIWYIIIAFFKTVSQTKDKSMNTCDHFQSRPVPVQLDLLPLSQWECRRSRGCSSLEKSYSRCLNKSSIFLRTPEIHHQEQVPFLISFSSQLQLVLQYNDLKDVKKDLSVSNLQLKNWIKIRHQNNKTEQITDKK